MVGSGRQGQSFATQTIHHILQHKSVPSNSTGGGGFSILFDENCSVPLAELVQELNYLLHFTGAYGDLVLAVD